MFVACGIWCLADVSSVSPSSEQTISTLLIKPIYFPGIHNLSVYVFGNASADWF